jgi:hypothetical protein
MERRRLSVVPLGRDQVMASDVWFVISRRRDGLVVSRRWLGMGRTRDEMRDVLTDREPNASPGAFDCYLVQPSEVVLIAKCRYSEGATQDEVRALISSFPDSEYAWSMVHGY